MEAATAVAPAFAHDSRAPWGSRGSLCTPVRSSPSPHLVYTHAASPTLAFGLSGVLSMLGV
eukprot:273129-Chlamydomonas_euryale.AAC.1